MRKEIEPVYQWQETGSLQIKTRNPDLEIIHFEIPPETLTIELKNGRELRLNPVSSKVVLLAVTPDIEKLMAAAGKECYSYDSALDIYKKLNEEDYKKFLATKIIPSGHHSVIEHGSFTFEVTGVSRAYSHQQVRHRIASYSQESQRYVNPFREKIKKPRFDFVIPPTMRYDREEFIWYVEGIKNDVNRYLEAIQKGKKEEDARMFLPNATATKIVVSMNPRALFEMLTKRTCALAQWEFDMVATQMAIIAYQYAPSVFEIAGPYCARGKCPERKRACGVPIKPIPHYINEENFPHDHLIFKKKK